MYTTPRKKGKIKKRRNPNPNTSGLKNQIKISPEGSAPKPVQVRVPANYYDAWMSFSSETRNNYLREAIENFLKEKNVITK